MESTLNDMWPTFGLLRINPLSLPISWVNFPFQEKDRCTKNNVYDMRSDENQKALRPNH